MITGRSKISADTIAMNDFGKEASMITELIRKTAIAIATPTA